MNDYSLQTEITEETKREVALNVELRTLKSEIQEHQKKIKKHLRGFLGSLGLLVLYHALLNFFWQYPASVFFFVLFGSLNSIHALWLLNGWRKKRQKLARWNKIVNETTI